MSSLTKRNYVPGTTVITSENLNEIQDVLIDIDDHLAKDNKAGSSWAVNDEIALGGVKFKITGIVS